MPELFCNDWPDPDPLAAGEAGPRFPTGYLPKAMSEFIEASAEELQTPNALQGMLTLAACAVALQGKVRVEVTPNWSEPVNLYTVISMEPSARKSPAFKHAMFPLEDWQREQAEFADGDVAVARAKHRALERGMERAETRLANATSVEDRADAERNLEEIARAVALSKPPSVPRLFVADCTPEALPVLMREQNGRIAIASDEGGGVFDIMAGRYDKNSAPNLDVYLQGYDGGTLRVDRKHAEPIVVENPILTIALTTQPDVLNGLAGRPGFDGRGLLGRILFVVPENNIGSRKAESAFTPSPTREAYRALIRSLLAVPDNKGPDGRPDPFVLKFTAEALAERLDFRAWIEPQLKKHGSLGHIPRWGGKLEAVTIRIAGLLHMAERAHDHAPWADRITFETFYKARRVAEDFLIPHALAAFGEMGADPQLEGARVIDAWIQEGQRETFTKRDAHQALRGHFRRSADLDGPLALLEESQRIVRLPEERAPGTRGRRPSPTYEPNPRLFQGSSEDSESRGHSGGALEELSKSCLEVFAGTGGSNGTASRAGAVPGPGPGEAGGTTRRFALSSPDHAAERGAAHA